MRGSRAVLRRRLPRADTMAYVCAALHFACQKGHLDAVRMLLAGGAKVQCRTAKGATALHFAAKSGASSVTRAGKAA